MVVKIYCLIWALGIISVAAFYLTGNFNQFTAIIFGFLSFMALFMGIFSVLASTVETHSPKNH